MAKTTKNEPVSIMEKTTKNTSWCSWIIKFTMKILPWLMLMHNLLYVINPSLNTSKGVNDLAWSNFISIVYLIGMQAWVDGGLIEV